MSFRISSSYKINYIQFRDRLSRKAETILGVTGGIFGILMGIFAVVVGGTGSAFGASDASLVYLLV